MDISKQFMVAFAEWYSEQVLGSEKQDVYIDFLYSSFLERN